MVGSAERPGRRHRGPRRGREDARAHIFGYTVYNDVSARDAQADEMAGMLGPAKGKDFDTGNILGPCIVTADEVPDPYALEMVARVNGVEWSRGNSSTMRHRFENGVYTVYGLPSSLTTSFRSKMTWSLKVSKAIPAADSSFRASSSRLIALGS